MSRPRKEIARFTNNDSYFTLAEITGEHTMEV